MKSPEESPPVVEAYDFLFLFDNASGSPKAHYIMIDPRRPSHIFPKLNAVTMNVVKGICSFRVAVVDNLLYILGGRKWDTGVPCAGINRFDPSTNVWRKLAPMKRPRSRFTAEVVNGYIYVIGGETKKSTITDSVERFDPGDGTWSDVASLPRPRADHASCTAAGKVYVSGGISNLKPQSSNIFWEYDPKKDVWDEVSEGLTLPREREKHNMITVDDSKIFVLGGRGFDHSTYMEKDEGSVCHFDTVESDSRGRRAWELSHPAIPHPRSFAGAIALDQNIWVLGGISQSSASHVTRVAMYNSQQRRWRETFSLPTGNFTNVELCSLSIPTHNTSFSFMDKYICEKWVMW